MGDVHEMTCFAGSGSCMSLTPTTHPSCDLRNVHDCLPERDPDTEHPQVQDSSEVVGALAAPH